MGSCLSKKTTICSSSTTVLPDPPDQKTKPTPQLQVAEKKGSEEDNVKKEIFLIKHRISHDLADRKSDEENPKSDPKSACILNNTSGTVTTTTSEAADVGSNFVIGGGVVRTSSCSKEEIDAILIQCGRLSRSSSTGKTVGGCSGDRKYSGSKRSYDFDHEKGDDNDNEDGDVINDWAEADAERTHRHRQRHRQSSPSSSSGRRTTSSREGDPQNQRSGSRERGSGGGGGEGRRMSRSPGKRSESPIITTTNTATTSTRPEKIVSVPATIFSLSMDKSGIVGGGGVETPSEAAIKRILVKRNVGVAASPRARSPATTRVSNEKQSFSQTNQPLSLSRSNSRKAEISPYRRNPLGEIDQNCIGVEVSINKASTHIVSQAPIQKPDADNVKSRKNTVQGTENRTFSARAKEEKQQQQKMEDGGKPLHPKPGNITSTISRPESLKHQTVASTRSLRRLSQDLDFNPETTLLNPSPTSYTALLLEDIQNFHQKGTPGMSLPHCLTKACSILEAVADLNSTTISNLSTVEQFGKKKRLDTNEPFADSEVIGVDGLMEPSFHKHVTVSRGGGGGGGDTEEVESYGSNSFIGSGQNWISSSLWENNSVDSTDDTWNPPLRLGEKKSESDQKHNGIGRGRFGSDRGLQSTTFKAASS